MEIQNFLMPLAYGGIAFLLLVLAWDAVVRMMKLLVSWLGGN